MWLAAIGVVLVVLGGGWSVLNRDAVSEGPRKAGEELVEDSREAATYGVAALGAIVGVAAWTFDTVGSLLAEVPALLLGVVGISVGSLGLMGEIPLTGEQFFWSGIVALLLIVGIREATDREGVL